MTLRERIRTAERALVDRLVHRDASRRQQRIRSALPTLDARSPYCADARVINPSTGRVRVRPRRRKVLILGGGSTKYAAQPMLNDPTYEVWCCNDLASICVDDSGLFRADRWFELHPRDPVVQWRRRDDFWEWLATMQIPVYQFGRRDAPQSVEFPIQRVIDIGRDYFACTFAYQIGLAMAEGFTTIALYGVDLRTAREATVERATVEWWAGYAAGKGLSVLWPLTYQVSIRAGHHPYRYGGYRDECEAERAAVYGWLRDEYAPTIPSFLMGNRPPWTLAEWWKWRRNGS